MVRRRVNSTLPPMAGGGKWSSVGARGEAGRAEPGQREGGGVSSESTPGLFGSSAPFLGTYTPRLDEKGRLILPAKFRGQLSPGLVMTRGPGSRLFVLPMHELHGM